VDYPRILTFFENPDTADQHARQLALLKKVCRHNPDGFPLADLGYLSALLYLAHQRIQAPVSREEHP
jgi:hypothetical protein